MRLRRFLIGTLTAAIVASFSLIVPEAVADSDDDFVWVGGSFDDSVSVGGEWIGGGSPGAAEPGSGGDGGSGVGESDYARVDPDSVKEVPEGSDRPGSGERNPVELDATIIWPGTPAAPGGGAPVVNPAELVRISDVKKLVMDAGQVSISPNRTWVYVNKPVYFATDAVAHDRQLTILGRAVTVHLTPVGYTWDPGDGSASFTTTGAGGTWPDGDVSHAYRKARSGISVGLTVEWSATFTVQGTTYPVAGTTTASTASPLFETREAEAVLTR